MMHKEEIIYICVGNDDKKDFNPPPPKNPVSWCHKVSHLTVLLLQLNQHSGSPIVGTNVRMNLLLQEQIDACTHKVF